MNRDFLIPKPLQQIPTFMWCNWFTYKNEIYFGSPRQGLNGHVYIDLSYCATRHLNNNIIKSVRWNKDNFTKNHLTN